MPWRVQICIAKFLFSYKDDLPESLNQTTANDARDAADVMSPIALLESNWIKPFSTEQQYL